MAKAKTSDDGGFQEVIDETGNQLVYRSWGLDKVGKNHFGFTMPGPIYGLYLDPAGIKGVAEKFKRGEVPGVPKKDIYERQFRFNKKFDDQDKAVEVRDQWMEAYEYALKRARSIQWDETETWELFRFAEFGRESAKGREFGPLNGMYRGLIQDAFDAGVNLQLIQKVKEKWANDKPTGEYLPLGFTQAGNIVQVSLEHTWDADEGFQVKIAKARQNTDIWGMQVGDLTFPQLGVLVYPDTDEDDWSQ